MVTDGLARRPGLVLAACAWVGFAASAAGPVQQAATLPGPFDQRIMFASLGFGAVPSLCLLVAAMLLAVEHRALALDGSGVAVAAGVVLASAALTVAMAIAGVVVLPLWSTSTPARDWVLAVEPYLTAGAVAALAGVLVQRATHGAGGPGRAR